MLKHWTCNSQRSNLPSLRLWTRSCTWLEFTTRSWKNFRNCWRARRVRKRRGRSCKYLMSTIAFSTIVAARRKKQWKPSTIVSSQEWFWPTQMKNDDPSIPSQLVNNFCYHLISPYYRFKNEEGKRPTPWTRKRWKSRVQARTQKQTLYSIHHIVNIGGADFDLSVFADSNNEQRFTNMFPQIN